jgi:hypothetical protein
MEWNGKMPMPKSTITASGPIKRIEVWGGEYLGDNKRATEKRQK